MRSLAVQGAARAREEPIEIRWCRDGRGRWLQDEPRPLREV
jgi:hypothetical protein